MKFVTDSIMVKLNKINIWETSLGALVLMFRGSVAKSKFDNVILF